jgi:glycosyltransferase involved in cell wall biosynthesis
MLVSSLAAGGAERVATTLCNAWASRGDRVWLVPTFSAGGTSFYEIADGVEMVYLANAAGTKGAILGYVKRQYVLRKLIQSWSPDVIVSFLPNVNVAAILSTAFLRVPLIICERSDPTSHPLPWFWKLATKLLYRYADMLTVQTAAVARKVEKILPAKLLRAVPNPLPSDAALMSRSAIGGRKKLLSLGRLSGEKQIDRIIKAFAETAADFPEWDLEIYGDGPQKVYLSELIRDCGLEQRAFILGGTRTPWNVMAASDVFVMTSMYEGFPNALLEAMGIGLPCIAFDCPSGPREISEDGEAALLVSLNDQDELVAAMRRVMYDEHLRFSLGDRAKASVMTRFGLDAVLAHWDKLFSEVGVIP